MCLLSAGAAADADATTPAVRDALACVFAQILAPFVNAQYIGICQWIDRYREHSISMYKVERMDGQMTWGVHAKREEYINACV